MFQVIAFDADDTLWPNEPFYTYAKEKFRRLFAPHQRPDEIVRHLDDLEVRNVQLYGYGIKSYILSMIESAVEVGGDQMDSKVIQGIFGIARSMLSADLELFEGVEATLEALSKTYLS